MEKTIGLFSPLLEGSFSSTILAAVHQEAKRHKVKLIVVRTMSVKEHTSPLALDLVDGWIVLNESVSDTLLVNIHDRGTPVVGLNHKISCIPCPTVLTDNAQGMYNAVKHLIAMGHRRIAFMGQLNAPPGKVRFQGYLQALAKHQIPYDPELVYDAKDTLYSGGHFVAIEMLERGVSCSAIVSSTDLNAMGLIEKLNEHGYKVPEDIAVIGFDDMAYAASFQPPLSTVYLPLLEMAEAAVQLLLQMIDGQDIPNECYEIKTTLLPRSSCGSNVPIATDITPRPQGMSKLYHGYLENDFHQINKNLVNFEVVPIEDFSWLANMYWGCMATLENGENNQSLVRIKQYFNRKNEVSEAVLGQTYASESFPSKAILPQDFMNSMDFLILNVIRTERKEWGVIALIGPANHDPGRFLYGISAMSNYFDLIATSVELEELFNEARRGEKLYRELAEQLGRVSRATSDSIWIWDMQLQRIEWSNDRVIQLLGLIDNALTVEADVFWDRLHPEDSVELRSMLDQHIQTGESFQTQLKMRSGDGSYLWFYVAGEVMRDRNHVPIKMVGSLRDITKHKQVEDQIIYLAYHDSLTTLPNRLLLEERMKMALSQAEKHNNQLAVLLIDLDRFKMVNDSYGHPIGDKLLIDFSNRFRKNIPDYVTLARLGGDEFVALIPRLTNEAEAFALGQSIQDLLNEPFMYHPLEFYMTASIGICIYPQGGTDLISLLQNADIAMYQAKSMGRNQIQMFHQGMGVHPIEWVQMEVRLRKALAQNELDLYFQIQVDLHTGETSGAEALLRWSSAELGMVSPDKFIPLAEETGLIIPIGEWVIRKACLQTRKWQEQGLENFKVAINVSSKQLEQPDFVHRLKSIIQETEVNPSFLCVEITESWAIQHINSSISMLQELISIGIHIALDDFGTGYSSLALLKKLPIHYVKIDRSFVQNLMTDIGDAAIVQAIITMSHSLNMKVVAEGVETNEQYELLKGYRCDVFQGYLFGKPQPAACLEIRMS